MLTHTTSLSGGNYIEIELTKGGATIQLPTDAQYMQWFNEIAVKKAEVFTLRELHIIECFLELGCVPNRLKFEPLEKDIKVIKKKIDVLSRG